LWKLKGLTKGEIFGRDFGRFFEIAKFCEIVGSFFYRFENANSGQNGVVSVNWLVCGFR
jgi:hypothetical protein